jgi:hypothetical protein
MAVDLVLEVTGIAEGEGHGAAGCRGAADGERRGGGIEDFADPGDGEDSGAALAGVLLRLTDVGGGGGEPP